MTPSFPEDIIDIGKGRRAHFRRRLTQVEVAFTAPKGIDPNPGPELTDQFKELGWTWKSRFPDKPWVHQLERPTSDDPSARGDSRDVLHEQFLLIIQDYRVEHGMAPFLDPLHTQPVETPEVQSKKETRAGGSDMLDAFAGVGVERFDLTLTDRHGEKVAFHRNQSLDHLRASLPGIIQDAKKNQHNVIIRPRGPVIQLDDLDEAAVDRLLPVSFLVLRTSPGNHQAWIAVEADQDFARRLRKGVGADLAASGATRVSGSLNFKERYAPAFPTIETVYTNPRIVTKAELEGFLSPPEKFTLIRKDRTEPRGWPSYERCLEGAPEAREGGRPDISRADFTFCLMAIDWGWSAEETANRLMQESSKAHGNEAYAQRTALAAEKAVLKRGEKRR